MLKPAYLFTTGCLVLLCTSFSYGFDGFNPKWTECVPEQTCVELPEVCGCGNVHIHKQYKDAYMEWHDQTAPVIDCECPELHELNDNTSQH